MNYVKTRSLHVRSIGAVLLLFLWSSIIWASDFEGAGLADGSIILAFSTDEACGSATATMEFEGVLRLQAGPITISATGIATGRGCADLSTLEVRAWALIEAEGHTASGAPMTLRGGITFLDARSLNDSKAHGEGTGRFDLLITLPDHALRATGSIEGEASAMFVPPRDPSTMQLHGKGSFSLRGSLVSPSEPTLLGSTPEEEIGWPPWPEDLLSLLLALLDDERQPAGE